MADISNIRDQGNVTISAMQSVAKEEQQEMRAEQIQSKKDFLSAQEEAINPFAAKFAEKQKPIETHKSRIEKMKEMGGKEILPLEQIRDSANQFQRRNPELQANVLTLLREQIKEGDTKEDILRKLAEFYPDVSLADEALDFLLATTDGALADAVREAKAELNKDHGREIIAGRNIHTEARAAAEKGLGPTSSMRDMYRDITGNPRDSTTLFQELSQKYAFKDLKKVVDFLLHSLGADMKSKGPSIPRGLLHRLFTETRSLQAILGVYRFFRNRMRLVKRMFDEQHLQMPADLDFEALAREFMALASERYPSAAKVMALAGKLGIDKWANAKIIVFSQMRDAVREVAMALIFKSLQHRDELYLAILEALEDLEDQLEQLEEEAREKQEEQEEEKEREKEKQEEKKKKEKEKDADTME